MLRISKLTDYATVILSHMAKNTGHVHSAVGVAEATGINLPTVSKIMKMLANSKILVSSRGSNGGYVLARTPEQISIADVISILEGPIGLTECSISHEGCEQASGCGIGANWGVINQAVHNTLASISLADMIKPINMPREFLIPVASLYR
jgi:FeS assembly SUF system regulator